MLHLVSWNTNGLDIGDLKERTLSAIEILRSLKPDIIALQEVVSQTLNLFKTCLPAYELIVEKPQREYFCVIFVARHLNVTRAERIPFDVSPMRRDFLSITCSNKDNKCFNIITSHLESLPACQPTRTQQCSQICDHISTFAANELSIFLADTNFHMPADENAAVPCELFDAWKLSGAAENCKFTYDMKLNDTYQHRYRYAMMEIPRERLDRCYLNKAVPVVSFELIGTEKVDSAFPSDHFGISVVVATD